MGSWERDDYLAIGLIRKPIGLRGWVGITPFGGGIGRMRLPATVLAAGNASDGLVLTLKEVRPHPKGYRALFEGVDTRDKAENLRDRTIQARFADLPPLAEEEYYHFELEGMKVYGAGDGALLGTVTEAFNYPSVDALQIHLESGQFALIPMTRQIVVSVDRNSRKIYLERSLLEEILPER